MMLVNDLSEYPEKLPKPLPSPAAAATPLLPGFLFRDLDFRLSAKRSLILLDMATPIWNRKRDLVYLVFFAIHIPVMFREFCL